MGHRRRRERSAATPRTARMGAADLGPVPEAERRVLLQAMGGYQQEAYRSRPRRTSLGRAATGRSAYRGWMRIAAAQGSPEGLHGSRIVHSKWERWLDVLVKTLAAADGCPQI